MYLVYLGESGNTGTSLNDPNQPHHVCMGLMIREDQWENIKKDFSQLCHRYFEHALGEPGTPPELHAAEIIQGKGFFSSWPKARRFQLIDDLLNILIQRQVPMIVSYVDKEQFASAKGSDSDGQHRWRSPWEAAFSRFVLALDLYMDELNMAAMPQEELLRGAPVKVMERAAIIADEGKGNDPEFMQRFLTTEIDIPTGAVVESMYFVRSQDSHCTQLADICTYFLRRHFHLPSRPNPQYDSLEEGHVLEVIYQVQP